MKFTFFIVLCILSATGLSQQGWTWTELDTMPVRISNNAVASGVNANGDTMVYSFSGIDSTKLYSGISLNSFAYNYTASNWSTITSLPDTMGKIATAASTVKNKIYIIGGYHVLTNGNEVSSSKVHVFDPVSNSFLPDGSPIPVPIDDQVQCVWRDSLIYVITGWSNTSNVTDVQIYDPSNDTWTAGTSTPNQSAYRMFGASGTIIGDTIYYNGGSTSGFNFVSVPYLRKGIINPADPTQITWSKETDNPGAAGYRMAATNYLDRCFWIGGSGKAYNYDGIAYDGSGGVDPLQRILRYESALQMWDEGLGAPYGIMDLRGIAQISPTKWIICGGMLSGQVVSNKTFLLEYDPVLGGQIEKGKLLVDIYPNPVKNTLFIKTSEPMQGNYEVLSSQGKIVKQGILSSNIIPIESLENGFYILQIHLNNSTIEKGFIKL